MPLVQRQLPHRLAQIGGVAATVRCDEARQQLDVEGPVRDEGLGEESAYPPRRSTGPR
jgi:hypothetical protein